MNLVKCSSSRSIPVSFFFYFSLLAGVFMLFCTSGEVCDHLGSSFSTSTTPPVLFLKLTVYICNWNCNLECNFLAESAHAAETLSLQGCKTQFASRKCKKHKNARSPAAPPCLFLHLDRSETLPRTSPSKNERRCVADTSNAPLNFKSKI